MNREVSTVESQIEKAFLLRARESGVWAVKMNLSGNRGFPDRMCLSKDKDAYFVELKRPKGRLRALQEVTHARLVRMGYDVYVIDSYAKVEEHFEKIHPKKASRKGDKVDC